MSWSVIAIEAAACYIGECRGPVRDAKIAMTVEGLYGFFIYTMIPVAFTVVLGKAQGDPLTAFTDFAKSIFGVQGSRIQFIIGIPLIVALLLSVLNAIMGCGRSLYQVAEDKLLPRWFQQVNRHGVPGNAITRIHGYTWGIPNPGLLLTRKEQEAAKEAVAQAIRVLGRHGVAADGQVAATRSAAKTICRIARARNARHIVLDSSGGGSRFDVSSKATQLLDSAAEWTRRWTSTP